MSDDAVGAVLRAGEDENGVQLLFLEQLGEQIGLALARHRINSVRHRARRLGAASDLHDDRLAQILARQGLDFGRHRRAEEKRLPIRRDLGDDAIELRRETHVEHAIRFVEHQNLEIIEDDVLPLHVIEQPARRRDNDIDALAELLLLRVQRHTAVDRDDPDLGMASVFLEALFDLNAKLASRSQNERANSVFRDAGAVVCHAVEQALDNRKSEAGGLARPRLCETDEVPPPQGKWNCLVLNRGRSRVARIANRVEELGNQTELRKGEIVEIVEIIEASDAVRNCHRWRAGGFLPWCHR